MTTIGETKDVPIVLQSIDYEDDYEGDFATRRAIIYTLQFTAKTYLYGPVTDAKVVRKTQVDYYANTDVNTAPRARRYTVQPESTIDRDGTVATTLSATISKTATGFAVANASGNNLSVIRGYEKTTPTVHSVGSNVFIVNAADNALLESDDDFGFGEIYSEYTDMKKYNPVSGQDEAI